MVSTDNDKDTTPRYHKAVSTRPLLTQRRPMVALGHFHAWAVHGMPMVAHAEAHSFLPYMGGKRRRGGTGEEAPGGAPWGRGEEAGGGTKTKGWGGRVFRTWVQVPDIRHAHP